MTPGAALRRRVPPVGWLLGLLLPLALVAALSVAPTPSPPGDPSSFATGADGTYALYHLLQRSGYQAHRLTGAGFGSAVAGTDVLVEAAPSTPFSAGARRALVRFVRAGGTILYAVRTPRIDRPVLAALGLRLGRSVPGAGLAPVDLPLGPGAPAALRLGPAREILGRPGTLPLLGAPAAPLAVARPLGRGHVYVLGTLRPLSNRWLRVPANARLVLSLLGASRGAQVLLDEIHHGYNNGDGVGALIFGTSLGYALLVVLVVLAAFVATQGRRLGRPLPPPELATVRSTDDHLRAMAALYARTRDQRAVARRYHDQLFSVLAGRVGLPPEASPAVMRESLAALGPAAAALAADTVDGLRTAAEHPVPPARLLALAAAADRCQRELGPGADPGPATGRR